MFLVTSRTAISWRTDTFFIFWTFFFHEKTYSGFEIHVDDMRFCQFYAMYNVYKRLRRSTMNIYPLFSRSIDFTRLLGCFFKVDEVSYDCLILFRDRKPKHGCCFVWLTFVAVSHKMALFCFWAGLPGSMWRFCYKMW